VVNDTLLADQEGVSLLCWIQSLAISLNALILYLSFSVVQPCPSPPPDKPSSWSAFRLETKSTFFHFCENGTLFHILLTSFAFFVKTSNEKSSLVLYRKIFFIFLHFRLQFSQKCKNEHFRFTPKCTQNQRLYGFTIFFRNLMSNPFGLCVLACFFVTFRNN